MRFITGLLLLFCSFNLAGSEDLENQCQIACAVLKIALNKTYGKNDLDALQVKKVLRVYREETRRELFLMLAQVSSYYVLARRNTPLSVDEKFGSVQTMIPENNPDNEHYNTYMDVVAEGVLLLKGLDVQYGADLCTYRKDDSKCLVWGKGFRGIDFEYVFDLQGTLQEASSNVTSDFRSVEVDPNQPLVPKNQYRSIWPSCIIL